MGRGQAHGVNRKYQEHCRDFLLRTKPGLIPYSGDGIDIPFKIGGTTWTIDVALRYSDGELIVAECKRRKDALKQDDEAKFAHIVELLRKEIDIPVGGVFFTKRDPQLGFIKAGTHEGITIAILPEGKDSISGFSIKLLKYDKQRECKLRDYLLTVETGDLQIKGGQLKFHHRDKENL